MTQLSNEKDSSNIDFQEFSQFANAIFTRAVSGYHQADNIDQQIDNPYNAGSVEALLYEKCWTDAVQWHVEDEIRDQNILPVIALEMKRRIDNLNQLRTNLVEQLDDFFLQHFRAAPVVPGARINTESPAWAVDRLSILNLKIYHMQEQVQRTDVSAAHLLQCTHKLEVLLAQQQDLLRSINELLLDISAGVKIMKVYRQVKMYNDPALNPVLYKTVPAE